MKHTKTVTKYLFNALFVLLVLSLAACGDSNNVRNSGSSNELVAKAVLSVTSTAPVDAEVGVNIDSKIVANFNKAVKSDTVNETSFTLVGDGEAPMSGVVTYDALTTSATFSPDTLFTKSKVYTAAITTTVEDEDGKSLSENFVWTFASGEDVDTIRPELDADATTPKHEDTGVFLNIKLNIVFTEAIDPATVTPENFVLTETDGPDVSGTLSFITPTTVEFSPDEDLASITNYTLELSPLIIDLAGKGLIVPMLSFTTGADAAAGPDTVNLRTAGNYVLLAKTGISTTDSTHITGDIAVSPEVQTALTGFGETLDTSNAFATSALVTGKLFAADMADPTPATLTTAVSDMEIAYTDAAGRADPDFTELGAGEIGGMTLAPGLYNWGTGVLVSADVTLNGGADDVWIFQIAEGLKLQDGKSIILTGGALPENVFWQVAEDVTLQAGTTFNGIILGQTGANMSSGAVLNGRALVQTAVTLIGNDINQPAQ